MISKPLQNSDRACTWSLPAYSLCFFSVKLIKNSCGRTRTEETLSAMKTRRKDALTSSRRSTRALTSVENSKTIPIDLFIEILLRLPAKSIARCRCVSKSWAYILRRTCFTELFLTRSRSRPQILFSCRKNGELFFFSTPHVQNPERSSRVTASYHMKFPFDDRSYYEGCFVPVNGLVCLPHLLESKKTVPMICNPSTGQSFVLPKVRTKG